MEYRNFGSDGPKVSVITYGSMMIGEDDLSSSGAAPSLLKALEAGITSVDTAAGYGPSEEIIGRTLKEWKGERPFISSKVKPSNMSAWQRYQEIQSTFTADSIRQSVENSLMRLQIDCLDFVQLHQWHYLWTFEEEWQNTMKALKQEGKVAAFGFSCQDHEVDAGLQAISENLVDGAQFIFNAFDSRAANSMIPLALRSGVGTIARGVLDHGGLTDAMGEEQLRSHAYLGNEILLGNTTAEIYSRRRKNLRDAFAEPDVPLSQQAIRFAFTPRGISTLTLALHRPSYLKDALAAVERGVLSDETYRTVREEHKWSRNFWEPNSLRPVDE